MTILDQMEVWMGENSMDLEWTRWDGAVVGAATDVCGWHEVK